MNQASPLLRQLMASPDEPAPVAERIANTEAMTATLVALEAGRYTPLVICNVGRAVQVLLRLEIEKVVELDATLKESAAEAVEMLARGAKPRPRHLIAAREMVGFYLDVCDQLSHRDLRGLLDRTMKGN